MSEKNKIRILVVEDDAAVRQTVSMILKTSGYDVVTAGDGCEALLHTCRTESPI